MPSISPSITSVRRPNPDQRPDRKPEENIRNHVQSLAATVETIQGPENFFALREIFEKFKGTLIQEGTWDGVQHLFVSNANKDEILNALVHCHIASFELGNQYLHRQIGPAHIDNFIRCVLGKLTGEARDSMLKDFPVLMRGPKLAENDDFLFYGFPRLALTLSETGLRLPLDERQAGNGSGDGGLRTQETEQLLARIQKEEARQTEKPPNEARIPPAPKGPAANTDQWLTERLRKFKPSFSARRDSDFSLNCKVKVDKEQIECRHIARLWEEDFLRTEGKPTYQTLNSPAVLQEAARPVVRYDGSYPGGSVSERLDGAQYWMSNDWGQVLTDSFNAMSQQAPKDGAVCRTLYLMTPNHVMAVGLKIKDAADARRYVVQFYDPNMTVAHQRSAITGTLDQPGVPAEIRTLKPRDFLPEDLQQTYLLVDAENRSIPALFCGEKLQPGMPRFTGGLPDLDGSVMHSILAYNLPEQLHAYTDQLKLVDDMTRLKILTSEDHFGYTGLFLALDRGNAEVVEALRDILKECQPPLSPAQLMTLLEARTPAGTPGLNNALWNGRATTVKAFGELLKECDPPLSSEQLMVLLSAQTRYGLGLDAALDNGHEETVEAFAEILKAAATTLTPKQFIDLLRMQPPDGLPALCTALLNGNTRWIEAYGKLLETVATSLPTNQLAAIVATEIEVGRALPQIARKKGYVEALAAFEALKAKFAPDA